MPTAWSSPSPTATTLHPEKVLFAAGPCRQHRGALALDDAGVDIDDRGRIKVDDCYRTSAPGIYAAGDVIGPPALASVSMEQARVAVCHAFGIPFKQMVHTVTPIGVYSIPEAAGVGLTEQQAIADGIDYELGIAAVRARTAASIISGTTEGFVKLVFRPDDQRLLGAHVLGEPRPSSCTTARRAAARRNDRHFIQAVYNVPTLTETYKYAAYNGLQRLDRR